MITFPLKLLNDILNRFSVTFPAKLKYEHEVVMVKKIFFAIPLGLLKSHVSHLESLGSQISQVARNVVFKIVFFKNSQSAWKKT